jgi:hypothetical protein
MTSLYLTKPILPTQTKNNGRKERPPKKNNTHGNNREGEDNNENLDIFENEDDNEVRAEVPLDEIKMLKNYLEVRDKELIR